MKAILIAEGDDRVAELFAYLFARDGWTVTTCLEGQCAADALGSRASYDAVLVSNRLHDMGGVELITRIRALDHRQDVPIVMVTGTVDCALLAGALAAGADDVLYKPIDMAILVDTVNSARRGPAAAAVDVPPPDPVVAETRERRCRTCRGLVRAPSASLRDGRSR